MMTPAQQKKALGFLKEIVEEADEQSGSDATGFDDHSDTTKLRLFLIEVGAMPDRRKKKK